MRGGLLCAAARHLLKVDATSGDRDLFTNFTGQDNYSLLLRPIALAGPPRPAPEPAADRDGRPRIRVRRSAGAGAAALLAAAAVVISIVVTRGPATSDVALAGTRLAPAASATAKLHATPSELAIELDVAGLPPSPPGYYYQAWMKGPRGLVTIGTFHLRGDPGTVEL